MLDSGNILFKTANRAQLIDQDVLTAQAIMEIYTTLHYDAMAIGPNDLAAGLDLLTRAFLSGTPWISANLLSPSGKPIFPPWVVKNIGKTRVGIVGLTGNTTTTPDYITVSWQESLPKYMDELTSGCDFIIMLSSLENSDNEAIADRFPQIQMIISTDPKAGNIAPLLRHNSLLTQTHTRGTYLGILNVNWPNSIIWQTTLTDTPSLVPELEKRYQLQLQITDPENETNTTKVDRLRHNLRVLDELQIDPKNSQPGTYTFRFRSLASHIQKNAVIDQRLAYLKQEIASANRKAKEAKPIQETVGPVGSASASERAFTGSGQCGKCHEEQYAKWQNSAHAHALASLVKEQQQFNVKCLSCHVTWGMAEQSGNELMTNLLTLPETRTNVGCESCHGAGEIHVNSEGKDKIFKKVTKETCILCHTKEMDAQFDFQTRLSRIGCGEL